MRVLLPQWVFWKKDRSLSVIVLWEMEPSVGEVNITAMTSAPFANRRKFNRMLALACQSGLGLLFTPSVLSGVIRSADKRVHTHGG